LIYEYGARNGIAPALFRTRAVVSKILDELPETIASFQDDSSKLRCLCYGPPGSGKTSIMGKLDEALRARFPKTPVYFVRCAELKLLRKRLTMQLAEIRTCVVLVDDAQEWYDDHDFFALFKGTNRLLVAAATFSVEQFNPRTPVEFQLTEKSDLSHEELVALLCSLEVDPKHHKELAAWYGDNYGRYHLLVPTLLERWKKRQGTTLADTFFQADTMQDPASGRLIPSLSPEMREILKLVWMGKADKAQRVGLVRYGIFSEDGQTWSCEFIRRKYFRDIFHVSSIGDSTLFDDQGNIPSELELLKKGFEEMNWTQLKQCTGSSAAPDSFPIEDIWQAEFYGGIGKFIPRNLTFCKEYVTQTANRVDFVLRNGCTRAIELLIKSSDVSGHHKRFENGAYSSLRLSGSYLVVDILPWDKLPDLDNVPETTRSQAATACFTALSTDIRRRHHAVFFVANDFTSGILYSYDFETRTAQEYARSPPVRMDLESGSSW
jgi:hypothetical protein